MLHLPAERLAALADAEPTREELDHLRECASCAGERAVYGRLRAAANAEAEATSLPLTRWETLAPRLAAESLIVAPRRGRSGRRAWGLAAAAVLLLTVGIGAGRLTAGATLLPLAEADTSASDELIGFESRDEALSALADAERTYQAAAAFLVSQDVATEVEDPELYRTRLATLDELAAATRAALDESPFDPVISRWYLSTIGAREATLRQLADRLPAGVTLTSY